MKKSSKLSAAATNVRDRLSTLSTNERRQNELGLSLGKHGHGAEARRLDRLYRLGRLLYRVIAFCVLALSITGGHIAHVHGRAVLYFVGLWPHVPKGSNQWLVINKDASNPDEKYWLSAAVDLAILAAIIFFFIWAEKSLRRARKQRRSESADDDVESGARSPQ